MKRIFRNSLIAIGVILVLNVVVLYVDQPSLSLADALLAGLALLMHGEAIAVVPGDMSALSKVLVMMLLISGTLLLAVLIGFVTDKLLTMHTEYLYGKRGLPAMKNHIVLIGLGHVGFRTWQAIRKFDESAALLVIEKDRDNPNIEHVRRSGTAVIVEDPRLDGVLDKAFVRDANAIVCCTDDDLANLDFALGARELNPTVNVVLRMYDQRLAGKVKNAFGIDVAFSPSQLAAPAFAAAAFDPSIINSYYLGAYQVVTARVSVEPGSTLIGRTLSEIEASYRCAVLKHIGIHGESSLYPPGDVEVCADDVLLLSCSYATLASMKTLATNRPAS